LVSTRIYGEKIYERIVFIESDEFERIANERSFYMGGRGGNTEAAFTYGMGKRFSAGEWRVRKYMEIRRAAAAR